MKLRRTLLIAALTVLALPGCTTQPTWSPTTPKQDLLAARKAYDAAGRAIVLYRTAGAFTESRFVARAGASPGDAPVGGPPYGYTRMRKPTL